MSRFAGVSKQIEEQRRVAAVTWPIGSAPFAVDDLIEAGRALVIRAVQEGKPVNMAHAVTIVDTLAAYVASLPAESQAAVSRRLVEALNERKRFTPTVAPKATLPKRGKI